MSEFGKRILILSPHPDDEVVGFCTAIKHAKEEGAKIFLLHLTHGCPPKKVLWPWSRLFYNKRVSTRRQEAERVAEKLDVELVRICDRPARELWRNLCEVKKDIVNAIQNFEIDQLWVPAYEGGNADHDGLNGMVASMRGNISILEFTEYNYSGGKVHSHEFPKPNGTEVCILLSDEDKKMKQECLELYASEQRNLNYVDTHQECYRPLAKYDYTKPAHQGTLWYKRFDWVPFPHPGVDRSKPENVCKVIGFFSNAGC